MAVLTTIAREELSALLSTYSVGDLRTATGVAAGSVNTNYALETTRGSYFLRVYEEQDPIGAARDVALSHSLAQQGVPTPRPIVDRAGRSLQSVASKPAALFPWVSGTMRCQASVTESDARAVGHALARVHLATISGPLSPNRFDVAALESRIDRIEASANPDLSSRANELRRALRESQAARIDDAPRGLVHGDLFRDNVLFDDGGIAALLDFESSSEGPYVYDLAVTILAWCFGDAFEPELVFAMIDGYIEARPLAPRERVALFAEARFAALRFTITRITDYALRVSAEPRVVKDWRRFYARYESLRADLFL